MGKRMLKSKKSAGLLQIQKEDRGLSNRLSCYNQKDWSGFISNSLSFEAYEEMTTKSSTSKRIAMSTYAGQGCVSGCGRVTVLLVRGYVITGVQIDPV